MLTATQLCQNISFLVAEVQKTVGCLLGGFSGGIFGTAFALVWSDSGAEDVALGVVGSILGGVVGGALGGAAVSAAVTSFGDLTRRPIYDVRKDTVWLLSFATGGVAGGAIGGPLGATCGALGAMLGAFWVVKCTIPANVVAQAAYKSKKICLDKPTRHVIACHLRDFQGIVKPLLDQLKHTQLICDKMASRQYTHAIATQTAACLDSAAKMEALLEKTRWTSSPSELVFEMVALAELSRNVNQELEEMRKGVETYLHQPRGDPEDLERN